MSVAIGYIHGEMVYHRFIECRDAVVEKENALVIHEGSGPNLSEARNKVVRRFLDSGCDWLYMCDTDTVFHAETIERMLARDKKVISALIYTSGNPPFPSMYKLIPDQMMFQVPDEWIRVAWPLGVCLKVDGVGAGCLLVHRDVYLDIEKKGYVSPWFQEAEFGDHTVGEDFTFCLRAAECGYEIFVDTAVRVGHLKVRVILCRTSRTE